MTWHLFIGMTVFVVLWMVWLLIGARFVDEAAERDRTEWDGRPVVHRDNT